MKTTGLILSLAALLAFAACGDDDDDGGNTDNPAFASAFPGDGFANRTATIALIGEDTSWSDASTVDFGAGITVDSIMSTGSTGLIASISIAPDAALGARDVTVTDSVGTTTLTGGFTVAAPLSVTITGTAAQGGAPQISIVNNDPVHPLDADGLDDDGNLLLAFGDPAVGVFNLDTNSEAYTFLMATDLNAPASVNLSIVNGAITDVISLDIAPTTPKAFTPGTDITETLAGPFDSVVYSYTATDLEFITFQALGVDSEVVPLGFLMDASGSYSSFTTIDPGAGGTVAIAPGTAGFIVLFHFDGVGSATVTASSAITDLILAANVVNEDDANNNDPLTPQLIPAFPGAYLDGHLNGAADEDWIQVTIGAANAANSLSIVTQGDQFADTKIEVYDPADTATPIAVSSDAGFLDSLVVPANLLGEGDWLIRIIPSDFEAPDPALTYRAIIRSLAPPPPA